MSPEPSPVSAVQAEAPELFIVLAQFDVGGTERHVLALTGSLIARGWRVTVYCLAGDGPLRGEFEKTGAAILLPPVNAGRKHRTVVARFIRLARVGVNLFRRWFATVKPSYISSCRRLMCWLDRSRCWLVPAFGS